MSQQLHPDCLNQIFGYYYDDSMTIFQQIEDQKNLRSCLLVNRLWCEASVRILWKTIQNYQTLVACLPNESKEILHRNGIVISTPTSKSPLFNYVAFVKGVSMGEVYRKIKKLTTSTELRCSDNQKNFIITQEIFKMLMNQISLKGLDMVVDSFHFQTLPFTTYPGTMDCLRNLSELICNSNVDPEFFHQVSRVCHHLRSLRTVIKNVISDGLTELISNQRNLKSLSLTNYLVGGNWAEMIPSITKLSKSLTKLYIFEGRHHTPLSFIEGFTNLRELELSIFFNVDEYFRTLQHVTLPRLQVLKFNEKSPNHECFIKFLETNGKNLQEIRLCYGDNLSNLAIAKFCPNLKSLRTRFKNHEVETLKVTLSRCQQLESIRVVCGVGYLNENRLLRIVTKYSPKPFHELIIHLYGANQPELFSKDLEPVFLSWSNRVPPRKSLSLIIAGVNNCTNNTVAVKKESMEVIEKFKKLGIIKRFEIK